MSMTGFYARVFGVSARAAFSLYMRSTLLVMLILLVTAIAIDLAGSMPQIIAKADELGVPRASVMAPYLLYRSVDIVTRLLPQACFFGLFFAEIIRARRYERIILALAGVSPAVSLSGVIVFGLFAGIAQAVNEGWARPAAVFAQVDLGVGIYAKRFNQGLRDKPNWFLSGDDALRARVKTGSETELREIELYRGLSKASLSSIVMAESAVPTDQPDIWRLTNVVTWAAVEGPGDYQPDFQPEREIRIDLKPVQLEFYAIQGYYLNWKALKQIAAIQNAPTAVDADVAIWRRWTAILLPGVFAFMGASLAQVGYPGNRQRVPLLVGFAVFGYLSIVSIKVFWTLGERAVLTPWVAVLSPIIFVTCIGILAQLAQTARKMPAVFSLGSRSGNSPAERKG